MQLDRVIAVRTDKTVFKDGDRCVKVFGGAYDKADVLSEALNQARAEEAGLPVPRVLEVGVVNGRWAIVSDLIRGTTLDETLERDPEGCIARLAAMQADLHRAPCPILPRLRDRMVRRIQQTELPATVRYELCARVENMPQKHQLCHGDFRPSNVMTDENGKCWLLDWKEAARGDGAADAARTCLTLRMSGRGSLADNYAACYCEKSGTDRESLRRWLPMVAAARLTSARAQERALLMTWLKEIGVV